MKKYISLVVLFVILWSSCAKNSCHCYKTLGFKLVKLTWKSNDSLVISKRFYYQDRILPNNIIKDSVDNFIRQYYNDSLAFYQNDSIYFDDRKDNLKNEDTKILMNNGYECVCSD